MASMAAECSLGCTSNIPIKRISSGTLRPLHAIRPWGRQNALPFPGLVLSRRSVNSSSLRCAPSSEIKTTSNVNVELEGEKSALTESQLIPSSFQVESLLSEICDTATIAEFELKFGGFRLYLTRNLAGKHNSSSPPTSTLVSSNMSVQAQDSNGSVSAHSLAISKSEPSGESRTLHEEATDKGLRILNSPRVGFFRRSRTIKGKRAAPPCKENQIVKEGQVLCYIEQLGGEIPIESDVAGEVVKILRKDGEAVGYGDALMEILPSFPGIKKLQ